MSEENKKVAIRFIEAFSRGDAEAAKSCLAPDAVAIAKGFGKLSGSRSYEIILATTGAFKDVIPSGLRPAIQAVTGEGDRVAVEFEGDATLANGERYCNQYCMVFTLRDGKIKQVNEYFCTILADEKIGPLLAGLEERRKNAGA
ncbi:MAG TPA: nuclear transport factor 2 family protein [Steroidobacteraceae bacterium]|nr:nuclear transport factor 2 family protein [Steroidobacteraceae bacterium]